LLAFASLGEESASREMIDGGLAEREKEEKGKEG